MKKQVYFILLMATGTQWAAQQAQTAAAPAHIESRLTTLSKKQILKAEPATLNAFMQLKQDAQMNVLDLLSPDEVLKFYRALNLPENSPAHAIFQPYAQKYLAEELNCSQASLEDGTCEPFKNGKRPFEGFSTQAWAKDWIYLWNEYNQLDHYGENKIFFLKEILFKRLMNEDIIKNSIVTAFKRIARIYLEDADANITCFNNVSGDSNICGYTAQTTDGTIMDWFFQASQSNNAIIQDTHTINDRIVVDKMNLYLEIENPTKLTLLITRNHYADNMNSKYIAMECMIELAKELAKRIGEPASTLKFFALNNEENIELARNSGFTGPDDDLVINLQ